MNFALRWTAALIALAVIVWIWFARDSSTTNSSAAATPNDPARELEQPNGDELASVNTLDDVPSSSSERVEASTAQSKDVPAAAESEELAILRVRVLSQESDAPIVRHRIAVSTSSPPESSEMVPASGARGRVGESMQTDEQGQAEFEVEPHRAYVVSNIDDFVDRQSAHVPSLEPGAIHEVVLRIPYSATLTVRIAPRNGAQLDADLRVVDESQSSGVITATTSNGVHTLEGLKPGRYAVFASTNAGQCVYRGGIQLRASPTPTEIVMKLELCARLTLRAEAPFAVGRYELFSNGARLGIVDDERGSQVEWTVPAGYIEIERDLSFARVSTSLRTLTAGEAHEFVIEN